MRARNSRVASEVICGPSSDTASRIGRAGSSAASSRRSGVRRPSEALGLQGEFEQHGHLANALRDWCRLSGAGTAYIESGSPWQNLWVEFYGSRIRDELAARPQGGGAEAAETLAQNDAARFAPEPHGPLATWRPSVGWWSTSMVSAERR
jgi:hypothetical protein